MHKGVWHGENAEKQPKRILILGESHHTNPPDNSVAGEPATYTTHEKLQKYMDQYNNPNTKGRDSCYKFFDKIVSSFGLNPEKYRSDFWSRVYFGNYIPVLCGVKDRAAAKQIQRESKTGGPSNRKLYNNALFDFVNTHEIDVIFCFSVLAYNNLPSLTKGEAPDTRTSLGTRGKKQVYLRRCQYKAGKHDHTTVSLNHDLEVYGIPHPSAAGGYDPQIFVKALSNKI